MENKATQTYFKKPYLFATKMRNIFRHIILDEEEFDDVGEFITKAIIAHEYKADDGEDHPFSLITNLGIPVDERNFRLMLQQFKGCSDFFIELIWAGGIGKYSHPVSAEDLRIFLSRNNFNDILLEQKRLDRISAESTKKLVNGLLHYLDNTFGVSPAVQDIKTTCVAAISLFPCLKTDPSQIDGIDRLYDNKSRSGILFNKIKNRATLRNKISEKVGQPMSEEEEMQLVTFFETAACTNVKEKKKIKEKLQISIEFRRKLLQTGVDLHKTFRYAYVAPDLIFFDFKITFPNVNENALKNMWTYMQKAIFKQGVQLNQDDGETHDETTIGILMLFKLFAPPRVPFTTATKSLVVFSEDPNCDPMTLMDRNNTYPYIITIMSQLESKRKHYIHLSQHVLSVPDDFDFLKVFELLFKIYKVFSLTFNPHVAYMMHFLERFVFKMDFSDPAPVVFTQKMIEIVMVLVK